MQRYKSIIVSSAVALALTAANLSAQQGPAVPGSGSGGGGDASAANQAAQIALETKIATSAVSMAIDTGNIATNTSNAASVLGATTDEESTAGEEGTISAKLRNVTSLLDALNTALSTLNAKLPSAAAIATGTANPTVSGIGVYPHTYNGSTWDPMGKATAESTGVQIVRPHALLADRASGRAGITDGSSTSVVAAQGSGVRFCATTIVVSNSSATNVTVDIRDGTAGSVLMTIPAAANMGGGVVPLQMPLCTTANTIFAADPSASASTVTITAVGFKTTL